MVKKFKKIKEEILHDNPWWSYKHDKFQLEDGKMGDYFYGESRGTSMVVPVLPDGRLILVMQYRYLENKRSIEFPGGGVEEGSHALKTAQDELRQETGYLSKDFVKVGEFQPSNGLFRDKVNIFLAYVSEKGEMSPDETEDIEIIYRHPGEIERMIQNNDIWCGQTIAAWGLTRHFFN